MQARLTKTAVESVGPAGKSVYLWDDKVAGFGVKVTPAGRRVYILKYRASGQQRWLILGRHGELTTEQARSKAQKMRGVIAGGVDPARERDERAAEPTVEQLARRYLDEYAGPHKARRSAEEDYRNLEKHVLPVLGKRKAGDVTRQEVLKLHHAMRATPFAANRIAALLSKMFSLAEEWGVIPEGSNPARKIKRFKERSRERFLSAEELGRLGQALDVAEHEGVHSHAIAIIRLLLLTGCRKTEICSLQWSLVDLDHGCLRLNTKTGPRTIRLGAPAFDLLAALPHFVGSPFVFPATVGKGYFRGVDDAWRRHIRDRAGLSGVRIHDLRHSFASVGAADGMSMRMIGELLGHRRPSTTMKYAHLADDPVKAAADRVASVIAGAMGGGKCPS